MTKTFSIKTGKIIGRGHLLIGKNCQDSLRTQTMTIEDKTYHFAWISDGCSEGAYSEVGANLATEFLLHRSIELIKKGVPLEIVHLFLFEELESFLRSNVDRFNLTNAVEQVNFIKDHFLFTLVGFIIGPDRGVIMAFGDGIVIINDQVDFRNFDDESPYPAYRLIDPQFLNPNRRTISDQFDLYFFETEEIYRLAIGSDAWIQEPDLLEQIWEHKHSNQIQRLMNLWSNRDKRLSDDATLIVVELVDP